MPSRRVWITASTLAIGATLAIALVLACRSDPARELEGRSVHHPPEPLTSNDKAANEEREARSSPTPRSADIPRRGPSRGIVVSGSGMPLPGVQLTVRSRTGGEAQEAWTDEQGAFAITSWPRGPLLARISYPTLARKRNTAGRGSCEALVRWKSRDPESVTVTAPIENAVILALGSDDDRLADANVWLRLVTVRSDQHDQPSGAWRDHAFSHGARQLFGGFPSGTLLDVIAWLGEGARAGDVRALARLRVAREDDAPVETADVRLGHWLRRVAIGVRPAGGEGQVHGARALAEPGARSPAPWRQPELEFLLLRPDDSGTGRYLLDVFAEQSTDLAFVSPAGGAVLTPAELEALQPGDTISVSNAEFLTGRWLGALRSSTPAALVAAGGAGVVRVLFAGGRRVESSFLPGGTFCVRVGDAVPARIELAAGDSFALVEAPAAGEFEQVR